jgi:amino acid transporter
MGRDAVLPRALGSLDARSEPLWSLAGVGLLATVCELLTGFSATAADALSAVLNASSVFLGLLFIFSAAAAVRLFWERPGRWAGVVLPAVGSVALLAVVGATVAFEERSLQYYAIGGVCLGVPFAAWRGRKTVGKAAGQPPGHSEPTALAP